MIKIYGIPNCDSVKKALNHLKKSDIDFEFVNFKKVPPTAKNITEWKIAFGDWPINKRGPTYRKIKDKFEAANTSKKNKIIIEATSAIKRPILVQSDKVLCFGYDKEVYSNL